jgi:hypothetical protein
MRRHQNMYEDEWRAACEATLRLSDAERHAALDQYHACFGENGAFVRASAELQELNTACRAILEEQSSRVEALRDPLGHPGPAALLEPAQDARWSAVLAQALGWEAFRAFREGQRRLAAALSEVQRQEGLVADLIASRELLRYRVGRLDSGIGLVYEPTSPAPAVVPTLLPDGRPSFEMVVGQEPAPPGVFSQVRSALRGEPAHPVAPDPWVWEGPALVAPRWHYMGLRVFEGGGLWTDPEALFWIQLQGGWHQDRLTSLRAAIAHHLPGRHLWVVSPPGLAELLVWLACMGSGKAPYVDTVEAVGKRTADVLRAWHAGDLDAHHRLSQGEAVPPPADPPERLRRIAVAARKSGVSGAMAAAVVWKDSLHGDRALEEQIRAMLYPPDATGTPA